MSLMAEKGEQAMALRSQGFKYREIAERLGISRSYAQALVKDPNGEQARARKMRGKCVDCGTAIYSDGPSKGPQLRCSPCAHRHASENAKWTRETIIAAIQRWRRLYGEPPTAGAWNVPTANIEQLERFRAGDYPGLGMVQRVFGRWSTAIHEAGFQCKYPLAGQPIKPVSEETYRAMADMQASGTPIREIAAHFGIKEGAAYQRLRQWKERNMTATRAEAVLDREIKRFEDRAKQAEVKAEEAREQARRLGLALAALKNGQPS